MVPFSSIHLKGPNMSISERYRELVGEVRDLREDFEKAAGTEEQKQVRLMTQAETGLAELTEGVGEIPRIRLESQLTPVLLKAHSQLDRVRLILEEGGAQDRAAAVWEMEQKIYRLLNDL
jgi:hypothetical protein